MDLGVYTTTSGSYQSHKLCWLPLGQRYAKSYLEGLSEPLVSTEVSFLFLPITPGPGHGIIERSVFKLHTHAHKYTCIIVWYAARYGTVRYGTQNSATIGNSSLLLHNRFAL